MYSRHSPMDSLGAMYSSINENNHESGLRGADHAPRRCLLLNTHDWFKSYR